MVKRVKWGCSGSHYTRNGGLFDVTQLITENDLDQDSAIAPFWTFRRPMIRFTVYDLFCFGGARQPWLSAMPHRGSALLRFWYYGAFYRKWCQIQAYADHQRDSTKVPTGGFCSLDVFLCRIDKDARLTYIRIHSKTRDFELRVGGRADDTAAYLYLCPRAHGTGIYRLGKDPASC
ncbi:hypothetical protein GQ600_9467 [Phytophthora cactorum]|nr:hypothetical protein GQ600_9467 [Phytophthora cactorum]